MGKEAVDENLSKVASYLELCRAGEILHNGYNLWVHSGIFTGNGGSWRSLGTTPEEVRSLLVQDLKERIRQLREGAREVDSAPWDFIILRAYFVGDDATDPIPPDELGITLEEIRFLELSSTTGK